MVKPFFLSKLLFLVLFSSHHIFAQEIIFVAPGTAGDGSSWEKASNDLQFALKKAKSGTQIWVAQGIYVPTETKNRSIAFEVKDGIALFGGFKGDETQLSERKVIIHPTILSGNIGSSGSEDNVYNVIRMQGVGATTILDGFIISNGFANGNSKTVISNRSGGGLFNDGSKSRSNPQIIGCIFIDNFAKDGGAVYNYGRGGMANPTFKNCEFTANRADLDGGAVNNDGRGDGESNPVFINCQFKSNKGNYGGAVFFYAKDKNETPIFKYCMFSENVAYARGGAIFRIQMGEINADWKPEKVIFIKNKAFCVDNSDFETICLR
jgi:hypothetical protein